MYLVLSPLLLPISSNTDITDLLLLQVPSLQNLAVSTLPDAVMRDSLLPLIYSSSESAANNLSKTRGVGGINKTVMPALERIGNGNGERTRYMKERNDYNGVHQPASQHLH